jgi:signal transduction histidine kinase/CheY-like chemotaxis protein
MARHEMRGLPSRWRLVIVALREAKEQLKAEIARRRRAEDSLMAEKERLAATLLKIGKLESLGIFGGGVAHDFNNILTGILANVSMAQAHTDADGASMLRDVENAVQRAKQLTGQLLAFAKGGEPVRQSAGIEEVIRETCHFTLAGSPVRARFQIPADIHRLSMDAGQISQVIQNIALNAAQAMPEGGEVVVSCANCRVEAQDSLPLAAGDYVRVCFIDDGPVIEAKYLGRLFEPYFTTKETGNGLGLAICQSIITKHNGHIAAASPAPSGGGAMFTVWLPASQEAPLPAAKESRDIRPAAAGVVLVMDDDQIIREVMGKILGSAGYTVLFAEEGRKALGLYSERLAQGKPVDCVILDLTISGGMGGKSAMEALRRIDPQVKGIISSGYISDPLVTAYADYGFAGAIGKPFSANEFLSVVQQVLGENSDAIINSLQVGHPVSLPGQGRKLG